MALKFNKVDDQEVWEVYSNDEGLIGSIAKTVKKGFESFGFHCIKQGLVLTRGWTHDIDKILKDLNRKTGVEEEIHIAGWKGKDNIEIKRDNDIWVITAHKKDKETRNSKEEVHRVSHSDVIELWELIKNLAHPDEKIEYRQLVPVLINTYDLDVKLEAFNGGKNRAKFYFPYYYYPVKILEHQGLIKYGGRGSITRIAPEELQKKL